MAQANGYVVMVLEYPGEADEFPAQSGDTTTAFIRTRIMSLPDEETKFILKRLQVGMSRLAKTKEMFFELYLHTDMHDEEGTLFARYLIRDAILKFPKRVHATGYVSFAFVDAGVNANWCLQTVTLWGEKVGKRIAFV